MNVETESTTPLPAVSTTAIAEPDPTIVAPPVIESVEYVRAPAPVYPNESSRRREHGIVLLRVLVDALGRPGADPARTLERLRRGSTTPRAKRCEKALFRPYEVNGVAQPAQVLIPIEFTRRGSLRPLARMMRASAANQLRPRSRAEALERAS